MLFKISVMTIFVLGFMGQAFSQELVTSLKCQQQAEVNCNGTKCDQTTFNLNIQVTRSSLFVDGNDHFILSDFADRDPKNLNYFSKLQVPRDPTPLSKGGVSRLGGNLESFVGQDEIAFHTFGLQRGSSELIVVGGDKLLGRQKIAGKILAITFDPQGRTQDAIYDCVVPADR